MINRAIVVVKIFEKQVRFNKHICNAAIFQRIVLDKINNNVPYTFGYVQIVNQHIINGIAKLGEYDFLIILHFSDDVVAYNIKNVFWNRSIF